MRALHRSHRIAVATPATVHLAALAFLAIGLGACAGAEEGVKGDASEAVDTGNGEDAAPSDAAGAVDTAPADDTAADVATDVAADVAIDPDTAGDADSHATPDEGGDPDIATDAEADADASTDAAVPADVANGACTSSADCQQPSTGCLGNVCLAGVCTPQSLADGSPCADGNPCTTKATCSAGVCAAVASVSCADEQPCTIDACDPKSGACKHTPEVAGKACDDGDACVAGTVCDAGGGCSGGVNTCGCQSLNDCAAFDDGDPCNGTLYCNLSLAKPACEVLPSSVVVCDPSLDGPCQQTACDKQLGACDAQPLSDGSACDDGNPCTKGDACVGGACTSEANTCQCQIAADCLGYDDGNACNGTLYCDKSGPTNICKVNPASVVVCPKSMGPCQVSSCDAKTGLCKLADAVDGSACEDGSAKTIGDACQKGACVGGPSVAQCAGDGDCAKWEDGDFCNGTKFCNKATGLCQDNPATVVVCPTVDNTTCNTVTCQPKSGLCLNVAAVDGKPCNDGDSCTAGDACAAGQCAASASVCECKADSDCKAKEDGDLCNGTLYCDKTTNACALNKSTLVVCPTVDDGPCSVATCAPKTGTCAPKHVADGKACDDGSPCSADDACLGGVCAGTKTCACTQDADCAAQDDGDLCNGTLYCNKNAGSCEVNPATLKLCPTVNDTECAQTTCQPATGACKLVPTSNGVSCDADGNPCTKNDFCSAGVCKPGAVACECYVDDDCAGLGAANKCVQAMICDKTTFSCKPGKQVVCDKSKDGPCSKTACDPADGQCKLMKQPLGTLCGESAICSGAQVCDEKGACVPGVASDCDDLDACTKDACDLKKGCTFAALDSGPCDDGDICSASDGCSKGKCVGTTKDCSDSSPCTDDACDPKTGCVHLPSAATSCDDGDACSLGDFCLQGLCLSGSKSPVCDDGNPCTQDACDAKQGCVSTAKKGGSCDDGDGCTKADACSAGACKGVQLSCDDGSGCTVDSCDKDEGCKHAAQKGKPCDDGNACTVGDACISSGLCASGQAKVCDDANPCTVDLCDPLQGCVQQEVVGSKCDDGNACTVNEKCDKGLCTGSPRDCDDGLVCSKDSCDKDAGCLYAVTAGNKCDDGNACTAGDLCAKAGACVPGPGLSCDDNNGCTTDACDPASGCTHKTLDGISCSDGDGCTQADKCVQGDCKGTGTSCDDGQVCTTDGCDPAGGCTHKVQAGATCSDNDACTNGDSCLQSGYCKPGAPVTCDDGNACTSDSCHAVKGCQHEITAGVGCSDGTACTANDACDAKGICLGSPVSCDDGKACTTDSCDKLAGCKSVAQTGKACDDSNACTTGDICLASGTCAPTGTKLCGDGNPCTLDSCSPTAGCVNAVQDKASCDDGSACTAGDACNGSQCVGGPVDCDDGQGCTKDSCDKAKGCVFLPLAATPCSDGSACTAGDLCNKVGGCTPGKSIVCGDGKACTADSCDPDKGCVYEALSNIPCDDADACTKGDGCAEGACKGTVAGCDDGLACTKDSCDKVKGCVNIAKVGEGCSDGNACTTGDACSQAGNCASGAGISCDDLKSCTADSCDGSTGCVNKALSGVGCDDADACTSQDVCLQGGCKGSSISCDDGEACTIDACDKAKGCTYQSQDGKTCDDGNACTKPDACAAGKCKGGAAVACDDKSVCTLDLCDVASGCTYTKLAGVACDDDKVCTVTDVCQNGVCAGSAKSCDDGNECTQDSCDVQKGCVQAPVDGKACTDGDECTSGDACKAGKCAGSTKDCSDGNDCTVDTCHKLIGCLTKNAIADSSCNDNDGCTTEACDGLGSCVTSPELWVRNLPDNYVAHDLVANPDGTVAVVGASDISAKGAFFQRFIVGTKQPLPVLAGTNMLEWRAIRRHASGSYVVIGHNTYGPETRGRLATLNPTGGFAAISDIPGQTYAPWTWDALTLGKTLAISAGVVRRRGDGSNGIAFGYYSPGQNKLNSMGLWKAPAADGFSRIDVNGIASLSDDRGAIFVTVSNGRNTTVHEVRVQPDGQTSSWPLTKLKFGNRTSHLEGLRTLVFPAAEGGALLFFEKNATVGVERALRYTPEGHAAIPDGPMVMGSGASAGVLRDNHLIIASQKHLDVFDRGLRFIHSNATLAEVPAALRVGPKRSLVALSPVKKGDGSFVWQVQRLDPWGNSLCSACFTKLAEKGCSKPYTTKADACNASNGTCNGADYGHYCNDGNACTTDAAKSDGTCVFQIQASAACGLGPWCQTADGACDGSSGGCKGTPKFKVCDDGNPCTDDICYGGSACTSSVLASGTTCADGAYCSGNQCLDASKTKVTLKMTQPPTNPKGIPFDTNPTPLATIKLDSQTPRWMRIKVKVDSGPQSANYTIQLVTTTSTLDLFEGQALCEAKEDVSCLPWWENPTTVSYPEPSRGARWIESEIGLPTAPGTEWTLQIKNHPEVWGYRYVLDWQVEYAVK